MKSIHQKREEALARRSRNLADHIFFERDEKAVRARVEISNLIDKLAGHDVVKRYHLEKTYLEMTP